MNTPPHAIDIHNLVRRYGHTDAVNGLNMRVEAGRCFGFFGRNGAGKTTTIKCLLNLLRPTSGTARVFGLDPAHEEVSVKSRLAYVPDNVAFYPWMTVRGTLDYCAAFRTQWNRDTERMLLSQFGLDPRQKTSHLSKGQRTQLALITAICPEPELLVLDEPTSGLDPIVRALLLSLPVIFGMVLFLTLVITALMAALYGSFFQVLVAAVPSGFAAGRVASLRLLMWVRPTLEVLFAVAIVALLFRFALVNHRSAERHGGRVWQQAFRVGGSLLLGAVLLTVFSVLVSAFAFATSRERRPPRGGGRRAAPAILSVEQH